MATRQQISQAVAILIAAYPNAKIIPATDGMPGTVDVYLETLQDLDPVELMQAVKFCIKTIPSFLPSVSQIRDAAEKIHLAQTGGDISGQEAWGKVLERIADFGMEAGPQFDDERIVKAVRAVGWRTICLSDEQDPAIRSQFIKAFEAIAARAKTEAIVLRLDAPNSGKAFALLGEVTSRLTGAK